MSVKYSTLFTKLFQEFKSNFAETDAGKEHINFYARYRQTGQENFAKIQAAFAEFGITTATALTDDLADQILETLLPHARSEDNEARGVWIHHAPAITGSIKKWYEANGSTWDWPAVAYAIYRFLENCITNPEQLEQYCHAFDGLDFANNFHSGMLTPMLNALLPENFLLINSKSQKAITYFSGLEGSAKWIDYPNLNDQGHKLIQALTPTMADLWASPLSYADQFDMFCYWLVAIKKYDFKPRQSKAGDTMPLPKPNPSCPFNPRTFELLKKLSDEPKKMVYDTHKNEFKSQLEQPFQRLMRTAATQLPQPILDVMETQKRLFGKILKNNWVQGNTWDFYWGAFYPKGGRRVEDAQLSMWINHERLEFGFYIGEYGSDQRKRFLRNCAQYQDVLIPLLKSTLDSDHFYFGSRDDLQFDRQGKPLNRRGAYFQDWLTNPDIFQSDRGHMGTVLSKQQILQLSEQELIEQMQQTYAQLFPLVLLAIHDEPIPQIREYLEPDDDDEEAIAPPLNEAYLLSQCAADTYLDETQLQTWIQALNRKGQAVLYGPPGTGKTFLARKLAQHLLSEGDGFQDLVQFHPAYTYEDFIQGIRPKQSSNGLDYPVVPGRFLEFCRKARDCKDTCVLIIDELNRANLSQVFGELMYLLEYRKEKAFLASGQEFAIPPNVRIIGTMNTADRSIALVDHALRRRFAFLPLYPHYEGLQQFHQSTGFAVEGLVQVLQGINQAIGDRHYEIGTSFFLTGNLADELQAIWQLEIEPYLEEYFFDRPDQVDAFRWEPLQTQLLAQSSS